MFSTTEIIFLILSWLWRIDWECTKSYKTSFMRASLWSEIHYWYGQTRMILRIMKWPWCLCVLWVFMGSFPFKSLTKQINWFSGKSYEVCTVRSHTKRTLFYFLINFMMLPLSQNIRAVPQLRPLVAGFPQRRPGFGSRSDHVGFVVDTVRRTDYLRVIRFPLPILIPPIGPHSSSSIIQGWYNRPIVAAAPSGPSLTPINNNNNHHHHHLRMYALWGQGRSMDNKLENTWKEAVVVWSWYYPDIYFEGTEENH
jgi:hypothetical protein